MIADELNPSDSKNENQEHSRGKIDNNNIMSKLSWRNELILNNSPDGLAIIGLDGSILDANPALCQILGYSSDELQKLNIRNLDARESPDETGHHISKIAKSGADRFETKLRHKDGRIIDVYISAKFCQIGDEQFFISFSQDITERKLAEKSHRESEEKYRTLIEMSPHTIAIVQDGKVAFANKKAAQLFAGSDSADVIGRDVFEAVPEYEIVRLRAFAERRCSGDATVPVRYKATLRRADGEIFPVEIYANQIIFRGKPAIQLMAIDITEQEQAAATLKESENKYRTLVEQTNAVTYEFQVGSNMGFIYISPQIEKLIGYNADELMSNPQLWLKLVHPEDNQRAREGVERRLRGETPLSNEYRVIAKSGNIVWVKNEAIVKCDGKGNPHIIRGVLLDITGLKETEATLASSEQRYQELFNFALEGIVISDIDYIVQFCNPSLAKIFEVRDVSEIIGKCTLDYMIEDQKQVILDQMKLRQKGQATQYELHIKTALKNEKTLLISSSPLFNPNGDLSGILSAVIDITERKKAEAALAASEIRYHELFNSAIEGIAILDTNITIQLCNSSYASIFDMDSPDDVIGKCPLDYLEEDQKRLVLKQIEQRKKGLTSTYELEVITVKNIRKTLLVSSAPLLDSDGKFTGILNTAIDISDRKRAEEALRTSEEFNRTVIEHSPLAVSVRSRTGKLLSCNLAWQKIWNKSDDEIKNLLAAESPALQFKKGDDYLKDWQSRIRTIYEQGGNLHIPEAKLLYHHEGGEHWVSQHFYGIKDLSGTVGKVVILTEDISERKQAENALRESERRFHDLFAHFTSGYMIGKVITDTTGKPIDYIYLEVNKAFEEMAGKKASEVIGRRVTELFPAGHSTALIEVCGEVASTGKPVRLEHESLVAGRFLEVLVYSTRRGEFASVFTDITERKRAQAALSESQQRLDFALKGGNLAFWDWHVIDDTNHIDERWTKMLGYEKDEIDPTLNGVKRIMHPDDYENTVEISKAHIEGKTLFYETEFRLKAKSGEWKWILTRGQAVEWDTDGRATRVVGTHQDVTARRMAEEAMRESEDRLRAIWENSPVGICMLDSNGVYQYVNKIYCDIYGYSFEELVGKPFYDLISPSERRDQDRDSYMQKFGHSKTSQIQEAEVFVRKGGESVVIQYTNDYVMQNGQAKYEVTMNIDITPKKRTEEALRESEEKYRLLVENASEVIVNADRNGKLLHANRSAARYFGVTPAELIGKNLKDFFEPETAKNYIHSIQKALDTNINLSIERKVNLKGEHKWFVANLQPIIRSDGGVTSVLIITRDVTIQKQAEIRNQARLQLLQNLRQSRNVDECLKLGCQAIYNTELFKRAVMTLHNNKRAIINLGQIGLSEAVVSKARKGSAPDIALIKKIMKETNRLSHSFFIPLESGIMSKLKGRYVPQKGMHVPGPQMWKQGDELFVPVMGNDNNYEGWLSVDTPFDGKRPTMQTILNLEEIVDITAKQIHEIQSLERLKKESQALENTNVALHEVLKHIQEERMEIRQSIGSNVSQNLIPAFNKLFKKDGTINKTFYNILRDGLPELVTVSGAELNMFAKLAPRQREICYMIKSDATSKEIASALNISLATVQKHRELIRKKLGINNKSVNLANYLKGIQNKKLEP
jgi:PAS domain S-box-containing protein